MEAPLHYILQEKRRGEEEKAGQNKQQQQDQKTSPPPQNRYKKPREGEGERGGASVLCSLAHGS